MNHITILVALALGMFLSSILVNAAMAYAQQISSSPSHSSPLPPSTSPLTPKLHTVKITSPTKGQQVPTGKDLTVSGVTAAGTAASHCQVSVIVNGVKPYQLAIGTGPSGQTDYSKWNFILTSKYTTINPGLTNKITAKHTCIGNPNLVSFSSVNVIGVGAASTATKTAAVQPQPMQQQNITKTNSSSTTGKNNAITQPGTSVTKANNTAIAINNTNTAASTSTTLGSGKLIYLGATKLPGDGAANTKSTTIVHHHHHNTSGKSATTIVHHHYHHNTGSHDRGKSKGGGSDSDFGLNSDSFPF